MDLLLKARQLESQIARTLNTAAQRVSGSSGRSPLEVIHAIIDVIEQEVVPAGRGRRVFPYNTVNVVIAVGSPAVQARYEVLLENGPTLGERILERVREAGAEVAGIDVTLAFSDEPEAGWTAPDFDLQCSRVKTPVEVVAIAAPVREPIVLTAVRGTVTEASYSLSQARIDVGRGVEVRDTRNQLLRTNHVAFMEDADEVNRSVSRRHAHITCDASGTYRLHDDGSAHGTSILRNGATISVRSGSRGVRLRDGDEIILGEARVRVDVSAR
jgi:hypothetical protein